MIRVFLGLVIVMGAVEAEPLHHIILGGLLGLAIMAWGVSFILYRERMGWPAGTPRPMATRRVHRWRFWHD